MKIIEIIKSKEIILGVSLIFLGISMIIGILFGVFLW